jgi:hypothetical protein
MYPVLVQLVLELIQLDMGDNTRLKAAHPLLDFAAADHSPQHRDKRGIYVSKRGIFFFLQLHHSPGCRRSEKSC